ncbi:MAG TPA: TetR/AcrR family transcriptional regulator [Pseudonocardiaceae bacterium]
MERRRLAKDDWTRAALAALGEGGLAAVAIEPLAARLGATKGSAYWHFANREALVRAALERWEAEQTDAVIARVEVAEGPPEQLRLLFVAAVADAEASRVQLALHAAGADPVVAPVLARVTECHIAYLTMLYAKVGFPSEDAARRATLAYTTYLGTIQLCHSVPSALPADADGRRAYLDDAMRALTVTPHA